MFLLNSFLDRNRGLNKAGDPTDRTDGVVSPVSETAVSYTPEPPPPDTCMANIKAGESEEIQEFRRRFAELAGDKMEVRASELMGILNKAVSQASDPPTDCLGIHTCRTMVAAMDSKITGKLGFDEFKYLWTNLKKWQAVYKEYVTDLSGTISSQKLPGAIEAAGFQLSPEICGVILHRYSEDGGNLDFDNFISCLVSLDTMFRAFKSLEKDGSGQINLNLKEWLLLTMNF